jgi:hypothetical protein
MVKLAWASARITLALMLYAEVVLSIRTHYPHHIRLVFVALNAIVICDVNAIVTYLVFGGKYHVV